MAAQDNSIINSMIAECKAKNVSDIMAFQKDWNDEVIAQFYATLYVEEHENVRIFHWMTEGQWFQVCYA